MNDVLQRLIVFDHQDDGHLRQRFSPSRTRNRYSARQRGSRRKVQSELGIWFHPKAVTFGGELLANLDFLGNDSPCAMFGGGAGAQPRRHANGLSLPCPELRPFRCGLKEVGRTYAVHPRHQSRRGHGNMEREQRWLFIRD